MNMYNLISLLLIVGLPKHKMLMCKIFKIPNLGLRRVSRPPTSLCTVVNNLLTNLMYYSNSSICSIIYFYVVSIISKQPM